MVKTPKLTDHMIRALKLANEADGSVSRFYYKHARGSLFYRCSENIPPYTLKFLEKRGLILLNFKPPNFYWMDEFEITDNGKDALNGVS